MKAVSTEFSFPELLSTFRSGNFKEFNKEKRGLIVGIEKRGKAKYLGIFNSDEYIRISGKHFLSQYNFLITSESTPHKLSFILMHYLSF